LLRQQSSQDSSNSHLVLLARSTGISRLSFLSVGFSGFLIRRFFGRRICMTNRFLDIVIKKRVFRCVPQPIFDRYYLEALYEHQIVARMQKKQPIRMQINHPRQPFDAVLIGNSTVFLFKRGDTSSVVFLDSSHHTMLNVTFIAFCPFKRILLIGDISGRIAVCSFDDKLKKVKREVVTDLKRSVISIEGRTIGFKTVFVVVSDRNYVTLLEYNSKYEEKTSELFGLHHIITSQPCLSRSSVTIIGFSSMLVPKFKTRSHVILVGSVFGLVVAFEIGDHSPRKLFEQVVHKYEHDNHVIGISYLPERDCFQSISKDGQSIYWTLTQNSRGIFEKIDVIQK